MTRERGRKRGREKKRKKKKAATQLRKREEKISREIEEDGDGKRRYTAK